MNNFATPPSVLQYEYAQRLECDEVGLSQLHIARSDHLEHLPARFGTRSDVSAECFTERFETFLIA
jgi:hypothetical protein